MAKKTEFVSPLMSFKEAAAMTTLGVDILRIMSEAGEFPRAVQLGKRRKAYVRQDVMEWISAKIGKVAA